MDHQLLRHSEDFQKILKKYYTVIDACRRFTNYILHVPLYILLPHIIIFPGVTGLNCMKPINSYTKSGEKQHELTKVTDYMHSIFIHELIFVINYYLYLVFNVLNISLGM